MFQGTQQKTFITVRTPKGEINFRAPPEKLAPTDNQQTSLSKASAFVNTALY